MKNIFNVIGMMSGTSLDGLDLAHCEFTYSNDTWGFVINKSKTLKYPKQWKDKLANAHHLNAEDLVALDVEFVAYL